MYFFFCKHKSNFRTYAADVITLIVSGARRLWVGDYRGESESETEDVIPQPNFTILDEAQEQQISTLSMRRYF